MYLLSLVTMYLLSLVTIYLLSCLLGCSFPSHQPLRQESHGATLPAPATPARHTSLPRLRLPACN